ncbi:MAG: imidazole glycerol phosphate synthase cyclase subunit, partial [Planctomycetota bacterium]
MLTSRIIPCLDVSDNRVVKGIQFASLRDLGHPADLAATYEQQGADELVVLDISATERRQQTQLLTIEEVRRELSIPLTVGGGVKTLDDVQRLTDAGADRVSVNTAAVARPGLIAEMATRFGEQCTVVAIDARREDDDWCVVTHAGKQRVDLGAIDWARTAESEGAGEILLTSFDRDGTRQGYDCELITAITDAIAIPVIASGGADSAAN